MTSLAEQDVVIGLSVETLEDVVIRQFARPPDRLISYASRDGRVRRLAVADPWRSVMSRARRVLTTRPAVIVEGVERRISPLRLARSDPPDVVSLKRAYARYSTRVRSAAHREGFERPLFVTFNPFAAAFAATDAFSNVTYVARDDWSAYPPHRHLWPAYEAAYAEIRDRGVRVSAVSQVLLDRISPTGPCRVVPNGVDAGTWSDPSSDTALFDGLPRPWILYTGTVDGRLSVAALHSVASAVPTGSIVLVGPHDEVTTRALIGTSTNVHVFRSVGQAALAALVSAADVCIVPHVHSRLTEAMSPLKVYEYLAAGRPVVATDLPPIRHIDTYIHLVGDDHRFGEHVLTALEQGPMNDSRRRKFIRDNSWDARCRLIFDLASAGAG